MITCNLFLGKDKNCTREIGHYGPCYWNEISFEDNRSDNKYDQPFTKEEYKACVLACKACKGKAKIDENGVVYLQHGKQGFLNEVFMDPRYGLGNRNNPKIMIIQDCPPIDPKRRMHGAFMQFYNEKGPCEILVQELMDYLGYSSSDIYATTAVKCASQFNWGPSRPVSFFCSKLHLAKEIRDIKPRLILSLGWSGYDCLTNYLMTNEQLADNVSVKNIHTVTIRSFHNVIGTEDPKVFINGTLNKNCYLTKDWFFTIKKIRDLLLQKCYGE